jgi:hypothetical protein
MESDRLQADFLVQPRHLFLAAALGGLGAACEHAGKSLQSPLLLDVDQSLMHPVLAHELRCGQLAPDRLQSYFRFEISRCWS